VKSTSARGYGTAHQALRRRWAPIVAAGEQVCAKCDKPIEPDSKWDLGHNDDRTGYTGPEHATCNRSAGGRNGALTVNMTRTMTIRDWPT